MCAVLLTWVQVEHAATISEDEKNIYMQLKYVNVMLSANSDVVL